MKNISRLQALLICMSAYLLVLTLIVTFHRISGKPGNLLMATFLYDIAATLMIFVVSVAFNNSSFYDPYWSLAPVPILLAWQLHSPMTGQHSVRQWIIITLVVLWSLRLTVNWIRRWRGLKDEDWRYSAFRSFPKPLFWLISLTGFHIFPTLIVFAGCLSVYPAMCRYPCPPGITDMLAGIVTLSGIAIEAIADHQLKNYLQNRGDKPFLSSGLWKYSRHPNYLGEILFWTGLFCFSLPVKPFAWYTLAGPVAMILMFSMISVPMMDKRMLERKTGYEEYLGKTSALIPWRRRK